jgi:hypothetical protein
MSDQSSSDYQHQGNGPRWPSLETQLAQAKVVHGSALENLIRDNQDFQMLDPEEANDRLGLPPWLRVYWRKLHPDSDYSGPRHGYPILLQELYEWMQEHQDLRTPPPDVVDPKDPRPHVPHTGPDPRAPHQGGPGYGRKG